MKLTEAQSIIREVSGKPYRWLKAWGLGWIMEAVRTIESRKSATPGDREFAEEIRRKVNREW